MADWHPEVIKAEVRRRGMTLAAVGKRRGLSRQLVALTLVKPHPKAERAIADFIGVEPQLIWPSRYDADGERLAPQPAENYISRARFHSAEARA